MHESYYSLKPRCGSEEMLERIRHNPPIYISLYEVLYYDDCLYLQRYSKSAIAKLEGARIDACRVPRRSKVVWGRESVSVS